MNVSLSGTTLTVNVDGHSDSVNLSSATPLSGSLILYGYKEGPSVAYTIGAESSRTIYSYNSTNYESNHVFTGDVQVTCSTPFNLPGYQTTYCGAVSVSSSYLQNGIIKSYSLQGSGTIQLNATIVATSGNLGDVFYSTSSSGLCNIRFIVKSGSISSASLSSAYSTQSSSSGTTSKSGSLHALVKSVNIF